MMKIVGLLLSVLVLGLLVYAMVPKGTSATTGEPSPNASLGAPPPADIARNAKAAEDYTKSQTCLANCAAEDRTCRATAFEPGPIEACARTNTACESRCR